MELLKQLKNSKHSQYQSISQKNFELARTKQQSSSDKTISLLKTYLIKCPFGAFYDAEILLSDWIFIYFPYIFFSKIMARFYDTMLAEYLIRPGNRQLSLDALAKRDFHYEMIPYTQVSQKNALRFDEIDLDIAAEYSAEDAYITAKIYDSQKENPYLSGKNGGHILHDIELPLMLVLSDMEMWGVKISRDILKGLQIQLEAAIFESEKEIYALAGEEFNIKSPKQVGEMLFEKLWLPSGKKTKTGYSVDAEVLEKLAKSYPIAAYIVEYRHYSKILSTYVDQLLEVADEEDKVHTSFNQTIAATGRLSSTNPNLQNIPVWDSLAGEVRSAFIPDNQESSIIAFDYSQIEIRLLAIMSGDEHLLAAFQEGRDIHQVTAEYIFKTSNISTVQRKFAKAVNFWVIYGISPFGLSKMIDISQKDARDYIDAFYANYPKVRDFYEDIIKNAKKNTYVETLFGRRRYIPAINDKNRMMQQAAEREAINMPIQGSNADIIKLAMIQIHTFMQEKKCKSRMILQVHDELVFSVVPDEREMLIEKIPEIMENILTGTSIKLKVDMGEGKNWKQAK